MKISFFSFMQERIAQLEQLGRFRTAETYKATLHSFMLFRNGKDLSPNLFSSDLMRLYEAFLKNRPVCPNTVSFYMRILRSMYNQSVEKGLCTQKYPFKHVYTGIDQTSKRALPIQKLREIKDLPLQNEPDLAFAHDLFLFSFYTRGMAFVDMAYLKKTDLKNNILSYKRRKTGQRLSIRWEHCMQNIIEQHASAKESPFLLPIIHTKFTDEYTKKTSQEIYTKKQERKMYINALHRINYHLKIISTLIALPIPLTTYVARHTWANIAKNQNIPIDVISEGLGHHSEATTRIYLASLDTSIIDEANRKIIDIV